MKRSRVLVLALLLGVLLSGGAAADDGKDDGVLITLHLDEADVRQAIARIAKQANANIIISQDVEGEVTCLIRNIPWREALEHVAKIVGATVIEEDHGILRIMGAGATSDEPFTGKTWSLTRRYDVRDLLEFFDPLGVLRPVAPEARIAQEDTVIVVVGTAADHEAIERALVEARRARDAADASDRLREMVEEKRIRGFQAEDQASEQIFNWLKTVLGCMISTTPKAQERFAGREFTMNFDDVSVKAVFDHVAAVAGVEWMVRDDGILFYAEGDDPESWYLLRTVEVKVEHRTVPTPITVEFEREEVHETGSADLAAEIAALREEIRALRKEVAEIKFLLLR